MIKLKILILMGESLVQVFAYTTQFVKGPNNFPFPFQRTL